MNAAAPARVVVVGTSLGGLHALQILLGGLGSDFPLPLAVVQHRGADAGEQPSQLLRVLAGHCPLPIVEVDDKEPMTAARIYLAPPDYHLLVEEGRFALSVDPRVCHARPSIDVLFVSAAAAYAEGVVAVLLTGASSDGTDGALEVRRRGGTVVVQDPLTAEAPVMPAAAIGAGGADHVLPLAQIAPFLRARVA